MVELIRARSTTLVRVGDAIAEQRPVPFLLAIVAVIGAVVGYFLNTNRAAVKRAEARIKEGRTGEAVLQGQLNACQEASGELGQKHQQLMNVLRRPARSTHRWPPLLRTSPCSRTSGSRIMIRFIQGKSSRRY